MFSRIAVVLGAVALALATPASADDGYGYGYVFATKRYATFLHMPSIKRSGSIATGWFHDVMPTTATLVGYVHDRRASRAEYDCDGERVRVIGVIFYLGTKQIHAESGASQWAPVAPDTGHSQNMKAICYPENIKGTADLESLSKKYREYAATLAGVKE